MRDSFLSFTILIGIGWQQSDLWNNTCVISRHNLVLGWYFCLEKSILIVQIYRRCKKYPLKLIVKVIDKVTKIVNGRGMREYQSSTVN